MKTVKLGWLKITKREFYASGGLSNPHLFRQWSGKSWSYYMMAD